jgi:hypothetical protein
MTDTTTDLIPASVPRAHRISETMRCRRMRVLYGRGHEPDPTPSYMRGVFKRGELLESYGVDRIREEAVEGTVITPKAMISTPFGSGEIDCLAQLGETAFIYDVKTMRTPHELKPDYAWQVRAYMRFFWQQHGVRPQRGYIVTICPSTLAETWYPIELTDADVEMIDTEEAIVSELIARRELLWTEMPERTCESPEDGRSRFCKMIGPCFQDWQPDPDGVIDDPDIVKLAQRLARAADRKKRLDTEAKKAETRVKTLQRQLRDAVPVKTPVVAGGVQLKRIEVAGRTTLDASALREAHVVDESVLDEFTKTGDPHDRWTVKVLDGTELPEDGDEEEDEAEA